MGVDPARRGPSGTSSSVLFGAILVSLAANLLYPGEVFFQSRFLFVIISILAFLITFISQYRAGDSRQTIKLVRVVFFPLLFLVLPTFKTINASRSQDVFWLFFAYACLFATLQLMRIEFTHLLLSFLFLVVIAFCIDLFSIYQYFFGLSDLKALVMHSTFLDEKLKSGVLTRITTRRVFANFPLPNTLAGFVSMMLPLNVFLLFLTLGSAGLAAVKSARFVSAIFRSSLTSCFLSTHLCMSLLVLALTQSFGGWACFCAAFALFGLWAIMRLRIPARLTVAVLLVVVVMVTGWLAWVTYQRGFSLWNIQAAENPIALRLHNYRTALRIFHDYPGTGVGLGNYGSINPRYQSSPTTIAQYAHNTFLQLLSESGTFFLALLLSILALITQRWKEWLGKINPDDSIGGLLKVCLEASIAAWLIHNLLDIDLYFPSLGSLGVFLLGILVSNIRARQGERGRPAITSKRSLWPVLVVLGVIFAASFFVVRDYLADSLCALAVDYGESKNFEQAQRFIDKAVVIRGNDATKVILQAKLKLLSTTHKQQVGLTQLLVLREAYEKATQLDVCNANYHYELSRILFALGETKLASQARDRATELFPAEPRFRQSATGP